MAMNEHHGGSTPNAKPSRLEQQNTTKQRVGGQFVPEPETAMPGSTY
jgi:hypothetical protein